MSFNTKTAERSDYIKRYKIYWTLCLYCTLSIRIKRWKVKSCVESWKVMLNAKVHNDLSIIVQSWNLNVGSPKDMLNVYSHVFPEKTQLLEKWRSSAWEFEKAVLKADEQNHNFWKLNRPDAKKHNFWKLGVINAGSWTVKLKVYIKGSKPSLPDDFWKQ